MTDPTTQAVAPTALEQSFAAATYTIWQTAAKAMGWDWSPAYAGYIRHDHHPDGPRGNFASYPSDLGAEDACFLDGIETLEQAVAAIAKATGQ